MGWRRRSPWNAIIPEARGTLNRISGSFDKCGISERHAHNKIASMEEMRADQRAYSLTFMPRSCRSSQKTNTQPKWL